MFQNEFPDQKIRSFQRQVSDATEDVFDSNFWKDIDLIVSAVVSMNK